uniref:Uncharacterized protein n=1 Tax=Cacopsylla melanoneura TaxID=428564 RepID=A0A8D8LQ75_9HEMI
MELPRPCLLNCLHPPILTRLVTVLPSIVYRLIQPLPLQAIPPQARVDRTFTHTAPAVLLLATHPTRHPPKNTQLSQQIPPLTFPQTVLLPQHLFLVLPFLLPHPHLLTPKLLLPPTTSTKMEISTSQVAVFPHLLTRKLLLPPTSSKMEEISTPQVVVLFLT